MFRSFIDVSWKLILKHSSFSLCGLDPSPNLFIWKGLQTPAVCILRADATQRGFLFIHALSLSAES